MDIRLEDKSEASEPRPPQKPPTEQAQHQTIVEKMGLEEIVRMANKIGLEYAEAKRNLDRLELLKPTVRARISIRLDTEKLSETKLRRLTETDEEYVAYLEQLIEARHQTDKLRIRYDSYKNLFDARRSLLSYQKAELKLL